MDDKTLQSLKAVFMASPTPDLAKIIALQLAERGEFSELENYLRHLTTTVAGEDGEQLGEAALKAGAYANALQFLNADEPSHVLLMVRCKLELGELETAQALYKKLLQAKLHELIELWENQKREEQE